MFHMSFFSIGKYEIAYLEEKKKKIKVEIDSLNKKNNVYNFKYIKLQKEMQTIQNRLKVLNNSSNNDIA